MRRRSFPHTKFAPVAPLALLQEMLERQIVGDYHLLLAHEIIANPKGWRQWARDIRSAFWPRTPTLIMDSSVIELGMPMEMEAIMQATAIVQADVVVLPDIIGDPLGTIQLVDQFEHIMHAQVNLRPGMEFMYVPQGKNLDEYISSIEYISKRDWITWVGLPRDALKFEGILSREQLIQPCMGLVPDKKIHLLGFSDNVLDDFMCCAYPQVVGIDSAVPTRAGQRGIQFSVANSDYGKRGDYFAETKLTQQAVWNAKYVREIVNNFSEAGRG